MSDESLVNLCNIIQLMFAMTMALCVIAGPVSDREPAESYQVNVLRKGNGGEYGNNHQQNYAGGGGNQGYGHVSAESFFQSVNCLGLDLIGIGCSQGGGGGGGSHYGNNQGYHVSRA